MEDDWIDMEEAQEINPFTNIGGYLDDNFLNFDDINTIDQKFSKQAKKRKDRIDTDESDDIHG